MDLEAASKHVPVKIPYEYTRVGYLLDHIQCSDATLKATMASCRNDTQDPGGARHDFEKYAMLLLPACFVAKTRKTTDIKRPHAGISSTSGSGKSAMGSSVVHLRWHKDEEFRALSPEQKSYLTEWRNSLSADESAAAGITDWAKDGNRRPGKKQKRSNGGGNKGRGNASLVNKLAKKKAKYILKKQKAVAEKDVAVMEQFNSAVSLANAENAKGKANAARVTAGDKIGAAVAAGPPAGKPSLNTSTLRRIMNRKS